MLILATDINAENPSALKQVHEKIFNKSFLNKYLPEMFRNFHNMRILFHMCTSLSDWMSLLSISQIGCILAQLLIAVFTTMDQKMTILLVFMFLLWLVLRSIRYW